jgi:hypothetical protein
MRLYTYALRIDDGAAPNPYGGVCTLTVCKPVIRRTAEVGDWVVGLGPTHAPDGRDLSRHIVYAMQVSRKLTYAEYDHYCQTKLKAKMPDWSPTAPFAHQVGDCLYEPIVGGRFRQRPGVHGPRNADTDVRGANALLAEHTFFYFGDQAVSLPTEFHGIAHAHQGHKVHLNEGCKNEVVEWILGGFGRDLRPRILYGQPLHRSLIAPTDDPSSCDVCSKPRIATEEEEVAAIC